MPFVQPLNAGEAVVGPLSLYIAEAGTPEPPIFLRVDQSGTQTLFYGTATANSEAAVTTALAAAAGEPGFGQGAKLNLTFDQPATNTAWAAWIAVPQDLASLPTGWTKATYTLDKGDLTDLVVYTIAGQSSTESISVEITFAGFASWTPLGVENACSITESGLTVSANQAYTEIRCVGSPSPTDIVRTQDDFMIGFEVQDLTAETLAQIFETTVSYTAATALVQSVKLDGHRPTKMRRFGVVARGNGLSSYVDGGNIQWYIPFAVQTANPAMVFTKENAAAVAVEFRALEDRRPGQDTRLWSFRQQQTALAA